MNFLSYLINGISLGSVYALIALGYTMVYGIAKMLNFAHGDVIMIGSYVVFFAFGSAGMNPVLAIVLSMVVCTVLGVTIERVAYRPLREAPSLAVLITAIGVSYLLQNLALYVTGGLNKNYPAIPLISEQVTIGPATTKVVTLVTPVLTIVLVAVLMQLIHHTKIGMAMRAVAKDFETSQLMGIKINSVISVTFIIGSFLAAVGSLLYFTNYPGVVPASGAMPGLKAFVAAVFGGIGSIPGAVVGAFLIGICENIIKGLDDMLVQLGVLQTGLGLTTFSDAFTFALLIVILIAKPTGLFGEKATDKV